MLSITGQFWKWKWFSAADHEAAVHSGVPARYVYHSLPTSAPPEARSTYPTRRELRLFGGVSVLADGRPIVGAAAQPRRIAVLAILADACPAPVTRERVVGLVWPEQSEGGARRLLTQALYELRRELGPVITPGSGRDLSLDASVLDVDLVQFRCAVQDGDADRAVALYRGPFLDGFHLRNSGEFERWTDAVRETSLRDLRRVIDAAVTRHAVEGNTKDAARWADRLLDATPHDASNVLRAMELHERAGDPGAAARAAATYERRMREDLELPPDEAVVLRAARIGQTASAVAVSPLAPSSSRPIARPVDAAAPPDVLVQHPWRGHRARVASLLLLGLAAIALPYFHGLSGRTPRAATPSTISIRRFDTHGDAEATHVSASLVPLLLANLDGAGGTQVDTTTAASGGRVLAGTVVVTGRNVRIDATLASRERNGHEYRASVAGPADSLVVLAERLAMDLLPELYANLDPGARREVVRGIHGLAAARSYLDGESAFNRAAFDSAYDALRAATHMDSGNALLWYRRAVAAEEVHHIDDADRSAAIADAGRAALPAREARLVHAYRVWRSGDIRGADSLYREILRSRPLDAEAWFHFAEVSYHGGPLIGHPLDDARDAWRRAVALDSNSFPALMHAIRLEARTGRDTSLHALLRRAERMQAREPYLSEARAIAAAAGGRRAFGEADRRRLDALPDASLQFVHAMVAGFVERPDLAREAAVRLVDRTRPDAVRVEGYAALAHLAMSRGQGRVAGVMLDSLGQRNAVKAAWARSYFATLPFLPPDTALVAEASHQLARAPSRATAAPLYLELSADAPIAGTIHRYTLALLASGASEPAQGTLSCAELTGGAPRDLCLDLEHGLAAEMLVRRGRHADALRELEAMSMRVPYQLAGRSVYYARTRERFIRAQLLERAGRLHEAYDWYASAPHAARLDYVYLAPSHLGRARVRERQGNVAGAAAHYARALELLSSADEAGRDLRDEASAGVQRMAKSDATRNQGS